MRLRTILQTLSMLCCMIIATTAHAMPLVPGAATSAIGVFAYQGDFNNDGNFDFVAIDTNKIHVNAGDGAGGFAVLPAQTFTAITSIASIVVCDIDGNGTSDLVMSDNNGMVYQALSAGNGAFTLNTTPLFTLSTVPAQEILEAAVDMNGNGTVDYFLTSQDDAATNPTATSLRVWQLAGGTYTASGPYSTVGVMVLGSVQGGLSVADINGDGNKDVVVLLPLQTASKVAVFLGNIAGTLATPVYYPLTNTNLQGITVADIDGVNGQDILVSGQSNVATTPDMLSVLLNTGTGTFGAETQFPMSTTGGLTSYFIRTADFNLDTYLDVVASQAGGKIAVLPGNGTGGFLAPVEYAESLSAVLGLFVGDINRDQKPDVVIRGIASGTAFSLFTVPLINTNTTALIQGAVSINGADARTSNVAVRLNLTCQTNTGALCASSVTMEFSNDNNTWSTPVVPWATTASWNLNPTLGTKTVYVRFADGAGNVAAGSDTIELVAPSSGGGCLSPVQSSMQLLLLMFAALFASALWVKRKDT